VALHEDPFLVQLPKLQVEMDTGRGSPDSALLVPFRVDCVQLTLPKLVANVASVAVVSNSVPDG
jgi:hypothetical protein